MRQGRFAAVLGAVLAFGAACQTEPLPQPATPTKPVERAPSSFDLGRDELLMRGGSPELVTKLDKSRFRYFRMIAEPFERRICDAFKDRKTKLPVSAVHGDPHLEQFVVTQSTYGIEDFDRSGFGPAVVDIVRYAASIHVACSDMPWKCDPDAAVEKFLTTWRAQLDAPSPPHAPPSIVGRLRTTSPRTKDQWLAWADSLMVALPADVDADVRKQWSLFGDSMMTIRPQWPRSTYDITKVGSLTMGFGSALERKVLFHIQGPTADPSDDLIIEARAGTPAESTGCIWRPSYGESLILMFTAIFSRRMPDIHGFLPLFGGERRYWINAWDPGYEELSVRDIRSQTELEEIVIDAAEQLGGHMWKSFPESLRPYQLYAQRIAFDETRAEAAKLARELAKESNEEWERFKKKRAAR